MEKASIHTEGAHQIIQLPAACHFDCEEVYVNKINGIVMLIPIDKVWEPLRRSLDQFSDDFMAARNQPAEQQTRPSL